MSGKRYHETGCSEGTGRSGKFGKIRLRRNTMVLALAVSMAGLGGMTTAAPAWAQAAAQAEREYAIPAGSLREALEALAAHSDISVLFSPEMVEGRTTRGVSGRLAPGEALRRLLQGSGLESDTIDATTFVLKQGASAPPRGVSAPPKHAPAAARAEDEEIKDMDKVVVRKPFTDANVDIVRTRNDVQPYYIFGTEQLEKASTINLEDFVKQRMTMNTTMVTLSQNNAAGNAFSQLNLRGLGTSQTLILVNGRRTGGASDEQFNLNALSPSEVERIEVLPSSASAIYGGNAVGGVINIVLKRDFTGGDVKFDYDTPLDTSAPVPRISAGYGWTLEDGKTNITLRASWRDQKRLLLGDRPELAERRALIVERAPGLLYSANTPLRYGATPNIASTNGQPLVFKDGTPLAGTSLGSSLTYVSPGISPGTSLADLQADLLANAGRQNTDMPDTIDGLRKQLGPPSEAQSLALAVRRRMTERFEMVFEAGYSSTKGQGEQSGFLYPIIPANSPANPFTQPVRVAVPQGTDFGTGYNKAENKRLLLGFVLDLARDWRMQGDVVWNRRERFFKLENFDYESGGLDSLAAWNSGLLNPFVDSLAYPLDLGTYMTSADGRTGAELNEVNDAGLRASGPVGMLPGGPISLTIGLGYRDERRPSIVQDSQGGYGDYITAPQSQGVASFYTEALVPLVGPRNEVPGVRLLELQVADRVEKYSTHANPVTTRICPTPSAACTPSVPTVPPANIGYSSNNYTVGLRYKPVEPITLRASVATAFLPPTLGQLVTTAIREDPSNLVAVNDPRRGNELVYVRLRDGGNPDLKPMDSKSYNFGVIFEPTFWGLEGLRLGVEWYRIDRDDLIIDPITTDILANEEMYPGRLVREAVEPGDPYGIGRIYSVDSTYTNANHVSTKGYDITLGFRRDTERYGFFNFDLLATVVDSFTRQINLIVPEEEVAGKVNSLGGPLKVRGNATLDWELGPWSLSWNTLYYGHYDQFQTPANQLYVLAQGSTTVPHQTYHNFTVGYSFPDTEDAGILSGTKITLGLRNIFNKVPPFDSYNTLYYYSYFGDPRLRSLQLSVAKRF